MKDNKKYILVILNKLTQPTTKTLTLDSIGVDRFVTRFDEILRMVDEIPLVALSSERFVGCPAIS